MEKAEARKKLKGLQLLVHNRGDHELLQVFNDVEAYIARERPRQDITPQSDESESEERSEKNTRDRKFKGGRDRGGE